MDELIRTQVGIEIKKILVTTCLDLIPMLENPEVFFQENKILQQTGLSLADIFADMSIDECYVVLKNLSKKKFTKDPSSLLVSMNNRISHIKQKYHL